MGSNPIRVVGTYVPIWGLSSAGRASALQAEGHRFEPYRPHLFVQKSAFGAKQNRISFILTKKQLTTNKKNCIIMNVVKNKIFQRVRVAQLDRALGYGPRCREFESSHAR